MKFKMWLSMNISRLFNWFPDIMLAKINKPDSKGKGTGKYERMNYNVDNVKPIEEYRQALENFKEPSEVSGYYY